MSVGCGVLALAALLFLTVVEGDRAERERGIHYAQNFGETDASASTEAPLGVVGSGTPPSPPTPSSPPLITPTESKSCLEMPCSNLEDLSCTMSSAFLRSLWTPQNALDAIQTKGTVFLSMYRHNPAATSLVMDEMWFNMLYHFGKVLPGVKVLVGMTKCPFPGLDVVIGRRDGEQFEKKGGDVAGQVVCHAMPHPCDCPQKNIYSRCKLALVLGVLRGGYAAFWIESDTVFLRNPLAVLPPYPEEVDMMGCYERNYHINMGTIWVKSNNKSIEAFERAFYSLQNEARIATHLQKNKNQLDPWIYEQAVVAQQFELPGKSFAKVYRISCFLYQKRLERCGRFIEFRFFVHLFTL